MLTSNERLRYRQVYTQRVVLPEAVVGLASYHRPELSYEVCSPAYHKDRGPQTLFAAPAFERRSMIALKSRGIRQTHP